MIVKLSAEPAVHPEVVKVKRPCGNAVFPGAVGGIGGAPGGGPMNWGATKVQPAPPPTKDAVMLPVPVAEGPVNELLASTVAADDWLLLPGVGSLAEEDTDAVLVSVEPATPAPRFKTSVKGAEAPEAR